MGAWAHFHLRTTYSSMYRAIIFKNLFAVHAVMPYYMYYSDAIFEKEHIFSLELFGGS